MSYDKPPASAVHLPLSFLPVSNDKKPKEDIEQSLLSTRFSVSTLEPYPSRPLFQAPLPGGLERNPLA